MRRKGPFMSELRESAHLEFKESVSSTFLKTVSAYANYGTGRILFGVNDQGECVGGLDADARLAIENKINDSLKPAPRFILETDTSTGVVTLTVFEGPDKPYLYHGKAYRRNDTSTVETSPIELQRLLLEGMGRGFDDMAASSQDFSFTVLAKKTQDTLGVERFNTDTLRTLGLVQQDGTYTNAAALLADENSFSGIEVVRFGDSISEIRTRNELAGISVVKQIDDAMELFDWSYVYERIEDGERRRCEQVPRNAFREAIANATAHRAWDIPANTMVRMWSDKIEVISPGSLPPGIDETQYLEGIVSVPRNQTLANVLFRLGYMERLGTGIRRIREFYQGHHVAPNFAVVGESVVVTLPVIDAESAVLGDDEASVLSCLTSDADMSRADIERTTGLERRKVIRILASLIQAGRVKRIGAGRGTCYRLA